MRRIFGYLLFAALVVLGLFFGQRNADRVTLDLYYVTLNMPLAVAVIGSVVAGVLLGALSVFLSVVLRQKARIRQLTRQLRRSQAETETSSASSPDPNV
jgi:putative membrane protein